jgi:hypothetical protein
MPDPVTQAIEQAGQGLRRGDARGDVLARLRDALLKAGTSDFRNYADALATDLETSIALENARTAERSDPAGSPEKYLMDSRWQPRVWRPGGGERSRWGEAFSKFPDDPARRILLEDREVIDRLLPLLEDRSPTRGFVASWDARSFSVPRVCDVAVSLVQFHGRVWFFDQFAFCEPFHARPPKLRTEVVSAIRAWWSQSSSTSVADGIRALLPKAAFYERASMAENLVDLGRETNDANLTAEGIGILVGLLDETSNRAGHLAAYVANTLEKYGDVRSVEVLYRRWLEKRSSQGYMFDSSIVFFLAKHGGRREWELLTDLAREGYAEQRDPHSRAEVGRAIVNSGMGFTTPWAVPALAMALDRTEITGSRSVAGLNEQAQSFSLADSAAEQLQRVTGTDFGYRPPASAQERLAAIAKARAWWAREGRAQYSFDRIEALIAERAKSPSTK